MHRAQESLTATLGYAAEMHVCLGQIQFSALIPGMRSLLGLRLLTLDHEVVTHAWPILKQVVPHRGS